MHQYPFSQDIVDSIKKLLGKEDFSYTPNTEGMCNIVYDIEDTYILRISRSSSANFDQEIAILSLTNESPHHLFPKVIAHGENKERMIYSKLPGRKLDNSVIKSLSPEQYQQIVQELSSSLAFLHPFYRHRELIKKGITTYDKSWIHKDKLKKIVIENHEMRLYADKLVALYEKDWNTTPYSTLGLLHNDLYDKNIFIASDLSGLSGIIDFGDCTIADIHNDFTFLYHPDNTLRNDVIDSYTTITNLPINKDLVRINAQIFILLGYLEEPERFSEFSVWIKEWIK